MAERHDCVECKKIKLCVRYGKRENDSRLDWICKDCLQNQLKNNFEVFANYLWHPKCRDNQNRCQRGHEMTDENYSKNQQCKACMRIAAKRYRDTNVEKENLRKRTWEANNPNAVKAQRKRRKRASRM